MKSCVSRTFFLRQAHDPNIELLITKVTPYIITA
nr:MAG TPA: hypothetical protein [Caudoviricetes sp.]